MKVYGSDYRKQSKQLQKELSSLDGKVRKRYKFLMDKINGSSIWWKYKNLDLTEVTTDYVIMVICEIEKDYADQSYQGNLFPDEKNK